MADEAEFRGKVVNGKLVIFPIIVTDDAGNAVVKVPSPDLIFKFKKENGIA